MTPKKAVKNIFARVACLCLAVYAVFTLVEMQVTLAESRQLLAELEVRYEEQRITNKELRRQLNAGMDQDQIERIAREEGYVYPDERVFVPYYWNG